MAVYIEICHYIWVEQKDQWVSSIDHPDEGFSLLPASVALNSVLSVKVGDKRLEYNLGFSTYPHRGQLLFTQVELWGFFV